MAEQEQDRSEAATPHKLRDAQKKGQAAKSQEAVFAAVLAGLLLVFYSVGPALVRDELTLTRKLLSQANREDWSSDGTAAWLSNILAVSISTLTPLFLAIALLAILANMAQVGAIFSFKPVTPDFERINPMMGFKRLFSITLLYNAAKSIFKLAALTFVLWLVLRDAIPHLLALGQIDVRSHGAVVMEQVGPMFFKLLLVIFILALLDIGYTRWDFGKKMRMSRREVRNEHKEREGDPRIRARVRQLRAEFLKQSRALRKLPDADVLITNPTHLAVAISYKHGQMPAPQLIAKGAGGLAAKMRKVARRHNIPVVENPPLARALYKRLDAGEYVPEDLYPLAARILLWVYSMRETRKRLEFSK
jgi:flagellar biosynthetic protein FlhB